MNCALPDGTTAPFCVPVTMAPEAMYGTSVSMDANTVIITISTNTGTSVLRVREPMTGPVTGYIVPGGNGAQLVAALALYMDAPDMSVALSSHDLHSKPLTVQLAGPITFLPDGRIAIAAANTKDLAFTVNVTAPLSISGGVDMVIKAGEMHLQLVSPLLRGGL